MPQEWCWGTGTDDSAGGKGHRPKTLEVLAAAAMHGGMLAPQMMMDVLEMVALVEVLACWQQWWCQ